MKHAFLMAAMFTIVVGVSSVSHVNAQDRVLKLDLVGVAAGAEATGSVDVVNNPFGPDRMFLRINGLPPLARIAVFLTEDQIVGGLPAQFVGEFTTNVRGSGRLRLITEVVDAFASANQAAEDAFGIAPNPNDGSTPPGVHLDAGGGANTISLNWLRGYLVQESGFNVFGPNETTLGGAPVFQSTPALP